jgi:hypothetical protein
VAWRLALIIVLLALLCPALAKAQTNLDQGKSAAQIFASVCVECHKEPRALAKGRSGAALAEFLQEHYTTNGQQAAALAAYVLGGRSAGTGTATQGRGAKPQRATADEPKPNRQGRLSARPEDRSRRNAARPGEQESPNEQPTIMRPVLMPPPTAHSRRKEPKTPAPTTTTAEPDGRAHEPAAAAAEPAPPSEPPPREQSVPPAAPAAPAAASARPPAKAAPTNPAPAESGENAPVPRDHIPD